MSQTEPSTFRVDTALLDQLRLEANRKQINLNTLVNQIFKLHVEWHAKAAMAGYVPLHRTLIKAMVDCLTEDEIDRIGNAYAHDLSDASLILTGKKHSSESVLELVDRWVKGSGFEYNREIDKENDRRVYVIQHNMGEKWSRLMAQILKQAISPFSYGTGNFAATDNTVLVALKVN